jgi:haloalkane dehalogenase
MSDHRWIDRKEYPFQSHRFEVTAGNMHYVDEGSGSPVVMIHGNPSWSFLYRHLIKQLRTEYRCVAMDHLGFGLSDKPADWTYLPEDHAANMTALIESLGLSHITLVVHDWGGPLGLSYAVANPENVARIIITNTWAWPVNRDWYYIAFSGFMGGAIGRMLIRRYNFFARSIMRQTFGEKQRLSPSVHKHYLRALAEPEDRKGCYVFPRQIVGATPWLTRLWSNISRLNDKPVLIVWGMKDIAFRKKELKRWESTFPAVQSIRLSTVGHFVQEEAPDEFSEAVVLFLKETTSA